MSKVDDVNVKINVKYKPTINQINVKINVKKDDEQNIRSQRHKAAQGYVAFNIFPAPQVLICKVGPYLSHRGC